MRERRARQVTQAVWEITSWHDSDSESDLESIMIQLQVQFNPWYSVAPGREDSVDSLALAGSGCDSAPRVTESPCHGDIIMTRMMIAEGPVTSVDSALLEP